MKRANGLRSRSKQKRREPKRVYVIREPAQLAALRSPVRQEIIYALSGTAIRTIAEIASMLGRSTHSLYHHVRALERVGLLLNMGTQRRNRRAEALYAAAGRRLRIHRDPGSPAFQRSMRGLVAAMLRLTERDFVRELARRASTKVTSINLSAGRMKGRLTAAQLRDVLALIQRLYDVLGNHPEQTVGSMHALTMVLAPVAEHASRNPGRRASSTTNELKGEGK
jgi:predicted transcriptional regulator